MKVTINPTEIKHVQYSNQFTKQPGERIALEIKSEVSIKLNTSNPVQAIVLVKIIVEDADQCIQMEIDTITGVVVSTFVDNLDEYVKQHFLPAILLAVNEKVRAISSSIGTPIVMPAPVFDTQVTAFDQSGTSLTQ